VPCDGSGASTIIYSIADGVASVEVKTVGGGGGGSGGKASVGGNGIAIAGRKGKDK